MPPIMMTRLLNVGGVERNRCRDIELHRGNDALTYQLLLRDFVPNRSYRR